MSRRLLQKGSKSSFITVELCKQCPGVQRVVVLKNGVPGVDIESRSGELHERAVDFPARARLGAKGVSESEPCTCDRYGVSVGIANERRGDPRSVVDPPALAGRGKTKCD
ncbi:hypothetical protein [Halomonas sp.]|uniref:hypothetical protein n=1 Tax=Halomonas sp. TaxID=1486246 RepID=UPI003A0FC732